MKPPESNPQALTTMKPEKAKGMHWLVAVALLLGLLVICVAILVFTVHYARNRSQAFEKRVEAVNLEKQKIEVEKNKADLDSSRASARLAQAELFEQLRVFKETFSIRNEKFDKVINQSSVLLTNETGRYLASSRQLFPAVFELFQTNMNKIASPTAVNTMIQASKRLENELRSISPTAVPSPELAKALRHDVRWLQEQITFIDSAQASLDRILKDLNAQIQNGHKPADETLEVILARKEYNPKYQYAPAKPNLPGLTVNAQAVRQTTNRPANSPR